MLIHLIQPRAPYGLHPYLPNGILNLAARLMAAGHEVGFTDFNIYRPLDPPIGELFMVNELYDVDMVGIGVLGTPYIPEAVTVARGLRAKGATQQIVVGGQGVMRLTREQFARIFAGVNDVRLARDDTEIETAFGGIDLPSPFDARTDFAMATLPKHLMQTYLSQEWCLFTSDGCVYSCGFCAASKGQRERFRSTFAIEREVQFVCAALRVLGMTSTDVYLSSLDMTQNPAQMETVLETAARVGSRYGVQLRMRGLATAKTLVRAVERDPNTLNRWRKYGVHTIGLGVDNSGKAVWLREHKQHNSDDTIDAALTAISDAGMTPEALTVIGFREDSARAILTAVENAMRYAAMPLTHRVVVRPYLGKKPAPGSDAWTENDEDVERFLANPALFRHLEYGMLASAATHPNRRQRYLTNAAFLATVGALKLTRRSCPTSPLLATEEGSFAWRTAARLVNSVLPRDK